MSAVEDGRSAMTTEPPLQLGMVGLGRMGGNLLRRAMRHGHAGVAHDVSAEAVERLAADGAVPALTATQLVAALDPPRAIWFMVPAGEATERAIGAIAQHLEPGDVVIDGGNTHYPDDIRRAGALAEQGIEYLDVGTSGGVWGLERGFCLMIGGSRAAFERLEPIFRSLAPGVAAADRTPGRTGEPADEEEGYLYCGPVGAGHLVKMVHNGIEYALMAAYAEGLDVLRHADVGLADERAGVETAPLEHPERYRYELDLPAIAEVWRRGSVVGSWLLDLTAAALHESPSLEGFAGRVADSGEGRWTSIAAIEEGVPAPVLTAALYARFASRDADAFGNRVLSAMRSRFGGHQETAG